MSQNLEKLVEIQIKRQPKPFIFGETRNTEINTNLAVGTVIYRGNQMPANHKGIVQDININFSTVAGTIILVKLNHEGNIISDITRGIASSVSGIGNVILQPGQVLGLSVQVQAAGILGVSFSGHIQEIV